MIIINKSETADTRTCDLTKVTKTRLLSSSMQHKADVRRGMTYLVNKLKSASAVHDWTKVSPEGIEAFYKDFQTGFKTKDWFEMHQREERHHLKDPQYVQEDVNLLDVLEMIVDGVMAGLARSGEYRREPIPDSLLRKAFENTIDLMLENVKVE